MIIHKDFEEFFRILSEHSVDYVIVGGYAVAFYGYIRATKDIDVLFRNSPPNIAKLIKALGKFGITGDQVRQPLFSEAGSIIRMGVSPVMIELINALSGFSFDEIWTKKVPGHYGKSPVFYISREQLIENKRIAGRPRDLLDIEELGGKT
jgi:hypothetical protein